MDRPALRSDRLQGAGRVAAREVKRQKAAAERETVSKDPILQRVLLEFPGVEITDIRPHNFKTSWCERTSRNRQGRLHRVVEGSCQQSAMAPAKLGSRNVSTGPLRLASNGAPKPASLVSQRAYWSSQSARSRRWPVGPGRWRPTCNHQGTLFNNQATIPNALFTACLLAPWSTKFSNVVSVTLIMCFLMNSAPSRAPSSLSLMAHSHSSTAQPS